MGTVLALTSGQPRGPDVGLQELDLTLHSFY